MTLVVLIGLALLLAGAGAAFLLTRRTASAPPAAARRPAAPRAPDTAASAAATPARRTEATTVPAVRPAAPVATPVPDELASLVWQQPDALDATRRQALVAAIRDIPRPPAALHQLTSPQFLERASSGELSDLINAEPQLAAKVLATVNSPLYGLRRPVSGIGQAVTFLGLNTVRTICLQYLLHESFKTGSPAQQAVCDRVWNASALASELCSKLALKLWLPDPGSLVTQVLLSFLGHLATGTLMPATASETPTTERLLDRVRAGQDRLGLGAGEVGGLLLQAWGLPETIVAEVRDIDRLLVTPASAMPPERGQRLAVAYLCARLGERLAHGDLTDLTGFDPAADTSVDFHHLHGHLAAPALARLIEHLQAADVNQALQTMLRAMYARA